MFLPSRSRAQRCPEIQSFRSAWDGRFVGFPNRNSFNHDFRVSFSHDEIASGSIDDKCGEWDMIGEECPGISAFLKDGDGRIFRTYSTYGRGVVWTRSAIMIAMT